MATTLPSAAHIALALSVVKSKPANRSVRDYINAIRNAIITNENCRHPAFDSGRYWQNEAQHLQDELDRSVATCAALRSGSPQLRQSHTDAARHSVQKRKLDQTLEEQMMGMLYDLQKLQTATRTDAASLSTTLRQVASALTKIASASNLDDPSDVLRVASRVTVCLVQGLDALDLDHPSSVYAGGVSHSIISIFSSVLNTLIVSFEKQSSKDHINALSNFLQSMYSALDTTKQRHTDLFEGYTYHLLQPIGKILHQLTPTPDQPPPSQSSLQTSLLLATPLLAILSTALRLSPRSFRLSRTQPELPFPLTKRHALTSPALAKLQRTLVHATLGDTLSPLDAAAERLRKPPSPAPETKTKRRRTTARRKEPTLAEQAEAWKGELWACLGWEILAYEGGLAELLAQ